MKLLVYAYSNILEEIKLDRNNIFENINEMIVDDILDQNSLLVSYMNVSEIRRKRYFAELFKLFLQDNQFYTLIMEINAETCLISK